MRRTKIWLTPWLGMLVPLVFAAPGGAQPAPAPPPKQGTPLAARALVNRLGRIDRPAVVADVLPARVRQNYDMVQAAIEAYRGSHFRHYPAARDMGELVDLLRRQQYLSATFQVLSEPVEFKADQYGYRIRTEVGDQSILIETPEIYNPFWSFLW